MKKIILALWPLFGYLFSPTHTKQETIFESTKEDTPSYFEFGYFEITPFNRITYSLD